MKICVTYENIFWIKFLCDKFQQFQFQNEINEPLNVIVKLGMYKLIQKIISMSRILTYSNTLSI